MSRKTNQGVIKVKEKWKWKWMQSENESECKVKMNVKVNAKWKWKWKLKSPTTDVQEDEPGCMAGLAPAHNSSVLPLLLFLLFIGSLWTVSCIFNPLSSNLNMYLVRSLQYCRLLAGSLFSSSFLLLPAIAAHVEALHFPLCPQGSYKIGIWGPLWKGRNGTWGAEVNEKQAPHAVQLAQLGRRDRGGWTSSN